MLLIIFVVFFLSVLLVLIFYLLSLLLVVMGQGAFKLNPFECGFMSSGKVYKYFSIHFFIMMLMFVIFDLEVVMFLSSVVSGDNSFFSYMFLFLFVLFGFYMEWFYGKLVWLV